MILQTKQTFDKVMLDSAKSSEFLKFVIQQAEQELVSKLIDELQDHKLHVVKLGEPWTENDEKWLQVSYRQILDNDILVQCKNCRMVYPWCQKFRDELGGNGFCPYGAEIIEKRVASCDREDTDCTVCFKESHCKALAKAERELK